MLKFPRSDADKVGYREDDDGYVEYEEVRILLRGVDAQKCVYNDMSFLMQVAKEFVSWSSKSSRFTAEISHREPTPIDSKLRFPLLDSLIPLRMVNMLPPTRVLVIREGCGRD